MARAFLITTGLLLAIIGPALAQNYPTPEDAGLNYSINVGAALLVNTNMLHQDSVSVGFSWFDAAGPNFGNMATFGLSADWFQIERNDGSTVQVVPLLFNYRQYGFISSIRAFVEVGVGILATTAGVPEMQLSSGANFGWTGGLGFDVTNNLFLHARFIGGSDPQNDGAAVLQIGYRF